MNRTKTQDRRADHDEDDKPDSPPKVSGSGWKYTAGQTLRGFSRDQCTDLAAGLTYFGVLAIFPAIIALMSLLGVVGQGKKTVDAVLKILTDVGGASVADTLRGPLTSLSEAPGALAALIIGLAVALWSASGYVGAFARAMNRIYQIDEGRPVWKLRPVMLFVTLVTVILVAVAALILVLSGPVVGAVGSQLGLGSTALLIWKIAKWPVLLLVVAFIVAFLYFATPNVKQPKFTWVSLGAVVAIVLWVVASALFGLYLATFASYNKTYGSMAGVIVFLLWLWITNLVLLFGAELNAALERTRELEAGIAAEEEVQLSPRDTTMIDKEQDKQSKDLKKGRELREQQREERS